jgi:hypothetical protein
MNERERKLGGARACRAVGLAEAGSGLVAEFSQGEKLS